MADDERKSKLRRLNQRQREVLELVCGQHNYAEISELLVTKKETVQYHVLNIYEKLGIINLPRRVRQQELGRFCPLLSELDDEPVTDDVETTDGLIAYTALPPAVLAVVVEDEPPGRTEATGVIPLHSIPIPVIEERRSLPRWILPWIILAAVGLVSGITGAMIATIIRPPVERVIVREVPATMSQTGSNIANISTATVDTTQVSVVSNTPIPSPTVMPTASVVPSQTSTPVPTLTPQPTPSPVLNTPPGTVLSVGESWYQDGIKLTIRSVVWGQRSDCCGPCFTALGLESRLNNETNGDIITSVNSEDWYAVDDKGVKHKIFTIYQNSRCTNWTSSLLKPGALDLPEFRVEGRTVDFANSQWLRIVIPRFSRIQQAVWQVPIPH